MSIAVDAMGGDHAPEAIVRGVLDASSEVKHKIFLVGDIERLKMLMPNKMPQNVELIHASECIEMSEKPMEALRKKRDSSISVGIDLVKTKRAEVFVSAGNTGACTAGCLISWKPIEGFKRPAIASPFPNLHDGFYLLDAGASPDIDPEQILDFAVMGRSYVKCVAGRPYPRVHLLNIGEEAGKGNAFAKKAYDLLSRFDWFAGNIEGKDMFHIKCDIVLCDAFVGNIVLKTAEGIGELVDKLIKQQIPKNKFARLPYLPARNLFAPLRKKMDYAEIGGSPLLGLNGLGIICHGRSDARAMKNAVLLAQKGIDSRLVHEMRAAIQVEKETSIHA